MGPMDQNFQNMKQNIFGDRQSQVHQFGDEIVYIPHEKKPANFTFMSQGFSGIVVGYDGVVKQGVYVTPANEDGDQWVVQGPGFSTEMKQEITFGIDDKEMIEKIKEAADTAFNGLCIKG